MLSAPLHGKKGPFGLIRAYSTEPDHFTADDATFLSAMASEGSIAIDRELIEAAIKGMLSKLDEHTNYVSPQDIDRFRTSALLVRLSSDVENVRTAVLYGVMFLLPAPISIVVAVILGLVTAPSLEELDRRLHHRATDSAEAVERRGSSIDDYTAPEGDGSMQERLDVYQRTGEPCRRCGEPLGND